MPPSMYRFCPGTKRRKAGIKRGNYIHNKGKKQKEIHMLPTLLEGWEGGF